MGVCYDTCHGFAAGYDIRTEDAYSPTMLDFDRIRGLNRLKFFHLNDSKERIGAHVDRHEHIGKGKIGLEGFRLLLNDPRFRNHPMVLETPKGKDMKEDIENLARFAFLAGPSKPFGSNSRNRSCPIADEEKQKSRRSKTPAFRLINRAGRKDLRAVIVSRP